MVLSSRRSVRTRLQVLGTVHGLPARPRFVSVLDVSREGCRIETGFELAPDDVVAIMVGELEPMEARVAWFDGSCAGLAFKATLSSRQLFYLRVVNMLPERRAAAA